jgi:hypothetical protein
MWNGDNGTRRGNGAFSIITRGTIVNIFRKVWKHGFGKDMTDDREREWSMF